MGGEAGTQLNHGDLKLNRLSSRRASRHTAKRHGYRETAKQIVLLQDDCL
jgi:hypothetical protein